MEQITNEMRCRIFAAYWGCKTIICYPSSNFPQYSVVDKVFHKGLQDKTEGLATHYKWNKLILKPLSSISDEDAIEVAKIVNISNRTAKDFIGCDKENHVTIGKYLASELPQNYFDFIIRPKVIIQVYDYLRSKSYDCGYGSIPSLIAAQIAISI